MRELGRHLSLSEPNNPVERRAHSVGSVSIPGSVPVGRRSLGALDLKTEIHLPRVAIHTIASFIQSRERKADAQTVARRDPRDMAKARLPEVQCHSVNGGPLATASDSQMVPEHGQA